MNRCPPLLLLCPPPSYCVYSSLLFSFSFSSCRQYLLHLIPSSLEEESLVRRPQRQTSSFESTLARLLIELKTSSSSVSFRISAVVYRPLKRLYISSSSFSETFSRERERLVVQWPPPRFVSAAAAAVVVFPINVSVSVSSTLPVCLSVLFWFSWVCLCDCTFSFSLSLTLLRTVLLICAADRCCLKAVLSSVYGSPEMSNTAQLDFFFFICHFEGESHRSLSSFQLTCPAAKCSFVSFSFSCLPALKESLEWASFVWADFCSCCCAGAVSYGNPPPPPPPCLAEPKAKWVTHNNWQLLLVVALGGRKWKQKKIS